MIATRIDGSWRIFRKASDHWRSFKNFNDTYAAAAHDILTVLDAASTTSTTVVNHSTSLDNLLLNVIGFSKAGTNLLATSKDNLVASANVLEPTTNLLLKYSPTYTCLLQGSTNNLENGAYSAFGGADGRTLHFDVTLLLGNDPYMYPDNLPIVAAKGGPGGKPGCGSLPDVSKNFPVRQLVTNTGWGTGVDIRPNPGIGHPCYADWLPVTRAVPEAPKHPPVHSRAGNRAGPVSRERRRTARRCTGPAGCRCGRGCRRQGPTRGRRNPRRTVRRRRDRRRTTEAGDVAWET